MGFSSQTVAQIIRARDKEQFTDFAIVCEQCVIPVHKLVLCSQSQWFRRGFAGKYKEALEHWTIADFSLAMVRRMVDFLYSGDYSVEDKSTNSRGPEEAASALSIHAIMFALAVKYIIADLLVLSAKKYGSALQTNPKTKEFLLSIQDVYTSTPDSVRTLRDKAVNFSRSHLAKSFSSQEMRALFDQVALDVPNYPKDLLDSYLQQDLMVECRKEQGHLDP